jgi:hypothetical protein
MNVERRRPRLRCRILVQDLKDYVAQGQAIWILWHRHSCLCLACDEGF